MDTNKNIELLELIQQERSWNRNNPNTFNRENIQSKTDKILNFGLYISFKNLKF